MELYTLDDLLRRESVIDRFESLIWTERYSAWGDFEVLIYSTKDSRSLLTVGTMLAMNESYRVMVVEATEDTIDSEGRQVFKANGRSLELVLDQRTARNTLVSLDNLPKWILTGTPGDIARTIFNSICRTNVNIPEDQIPFLMSGSIFPASTIPESDNVVTIEVSLGSVYKAIKDICDAYDLGFRLVRNFDLSQLYFDIYSGSDRTTQQSALAAVVFSPELDSLANTTELTSISSHKNVAYVYHKIGRLTVYADGATVNTSGFDRKVMHVDASDIELPERSYSLSQAQSDAIAAAIEIATANSVAKSALQKLNDKKRLTTDEVTQVTSFITGSSLTSDQKADVNAARTTSVAYNPTEDAYIQPLLQQRGAEELAKNRSLSAFDGELPANSPYRYNTHYNLGDLVEMRNVDGVTNLMRVTEQIFVSDTEGERSYPTLAVDRLITPGSWSAWDFNQAWVDADGTWAEA